MGLGLIALALMAQAPVDAPATAIALIATPDGDTDDVDRHCLPDSILCLRVLPASDRGDGEADLVILEGRTESARRLSYFASAC